MLSSSSAAERKLVAISASSSAVKSRASASAASTMFCAVAMRALRFSFNFSDIAIWVLPVLWRLWFVSSEMTSDLQGSASSRLAFVAVGFAFYAEPMVLRV